MGVRLTSLGWLTRFGAGLLLLGCVVQPARADCDHPGARWMDGSSRLSLPAKSPGKLAFAPVPEQQTTTPGAETSADLPQKRQPCPAGFRCGPPSHEGMPPPAPTAPERFDLLAFIAERVANQSIFSPCPAPESLYCFQPVCSIEHPPRAI
jgi:hypothetical protein